MRLSHIFRPGAALVACALVAPTVALAAALEQFRSFVAETTSARGEFVQRQAKGVGGEPGVQSAAGQSSGSFVFARPGRFIWHYRKPYEQLLQADGERLYIYDKDLNQVIVRRLGDALGSSPAAILFGSNDLAQNFTLKEAGRRDGLEWLEAIPKTSDTTFERILIGMKDGVPQAMELRDSFGQVTILNLSKVEKNPALKKDMFRFQVPEGADLLEQ